MTAEEQKKQEDEKATRAAKKSFYTSMAKYHEGEVARYNKQADDCEPVELASTPAAKNFGGL
jgi:hypothetical protein